MQLQTFNIHTWKSDRGGPRYEVFVPMPGVPSSTPGLAITRAFSDITDDIPGAPPARAWTLTHILSGMSLGVYFPSAALAGRFAQQLRGADWTKKKNANQARVLFWATHGDLPHITQSADSRPELFV